MSKYVVIYTIYTENFLHHNEWILMGILNIKSDDRSVTMPRKSSKTNEETDIEEVVQISNNQQEEIDNLTRMLAAVLDYLTDEDNEEIDVEYMFDHTEGLREWHKQYRESNRKLIEEEIKESLETLSFEELQKIREQIKKSTDLN